jgi:hypothetical protein
MVGAEVDSIRKRRFADLGESTFEKRDILTIWKQEKKEEVVYAGRRRIFFSHACIQAFSVSYSFCIFFTSYNEER